MKRTVATFLVLIGLLGATSASAQEARPGPGLVEVTLIPGGGTFFVKAKDTGEPSFGNYDLGAAMTFNVNRYVGLEADVSGSLGISQTLDFLTGLREAKSPDMVQYALNVVLSAPNNSSTVPYVTGGIGGLSIFDSVPLAIAKTQTFLTGNIGAGIKWYAGRWGLRADYRFIAVRSQDDAPGFFGRETRYGHRVYGGVLLKIQ